MTIQFPVDPGLPGLATLLDEASMVEILQLNVQSAVEGCRPRYVRYKPATSCIVQYDLQVRDASGNTVQQIGHVKIYADGRGESKATGSRADRLRERLDDVTPDIWPVVYLPEVEGVFQVYPADLDLRPLSRFANRDAAQKALRQVDRVAKKWRLAADPELIRFKPGRKALLRYQLEGEGNAVIYGKIFHSHDVAKLARQTGELIAAGVNTPAVLGTSDRHVLIVHEEVQGEALNTLRGTERYDQAIKPLAKSLWHLQSVEVPEATVHTIKDEQTALIAVVEHLSHVVPAWRERLMVIALYICNGLSNVDDVLQTAHGDFYDDQALISEDGLTLIDFDEIRLAHPLLDAGNMLAHLAVAELNGHETAAARDIFYRETREHFGADETAINLFECVGMLKLAPGPFRRVEDDWVQKIDRILTLIESRMLAAKNDVHLDDPKLPQTESLLSVPAMDTRFRQEGIGGLQTVDLIRHKPGRRIIVRYDLEDGTVLYGKSFASKRGAKVYEIATTLWDTNAFGRDRLMPRPAAWLPDLKLILTHEVKGDPIVKRLLEGDVDPAANIAFALYHLHTSAVDLERWHDIDVELRPLTPRLADICSHAPELADEAEDLLERLMTFDTRALCWRYRPIHRDMYHDQVLADGDQLVVLDLDDASMSEPLVDVANFTAHLMLLGIQQPGDATLLDTVILAFEEQYRQLDGDFDDVLYSYLVATTLFRLAGIHVGRDNGTEAARLLIAASRELLMHNNAYLINR